MTRDVLSQILMAAPGIEGKNTNFETQDGHRVSFYFGQEGRGLVVNEVLEVELSDSFVRLSTEEQGEFFVPYEGVHAVASKPLKEHAPKRTGFA